MSDRKRGRPREFDGTPVSVRLPARLHDELSREAVSSRRDLSDVIRDRLANAFRISKVRNDQNCATVGPIEP